MLFHNLKIEGSKILIWIKRMRLWVLVSASILSNVNKYISQAKSAIVILWISLDSSALKITSQTPGQRQ